jgi:hypothetical protein
MENTSGFEGMSTLLPLLQNLSQTLFKINVWYNPHTNNFLETPSDFAER